MNKQVPIPGMSSCCLLICGGALSVVPFSWMVVVVVVMVQRQPKKGTWKRKAEVYAYL
jgi:hypothetical protein